VGRENYVILGVLALSVLITAYSTYYVSDALRRGIFCALNLPIPLFIPFFFLIGLVAGVLVHKLFETPPRVDPSTVAALFNKEEEVFIVENVLKNGSVLQSEVSRRFGRVRATRAVAALEAKDIIRRERVGKTYVLLPGPALLKCFTK